MNEIKFGENKYCGPSVISAIVGCDTDDAVIAINQARFKPSWSNVKGVNISDLREAFNILGFSTNTLPDYMTGSLYRVLHILKKPGQYVLCVPGHFICIEIAADGKRFFCDNNTKEPINAAASARLTQQVVAIIEVIKREVIIPVKYPPVILGHWI